ncbi:MAG: ATP-dependent protease ATPase subunit HslU [Leptospiraceae bacterium]|nr:ATP-dependent protease ATPase subunit HslU [Leptospiraceae bacterium]
MNELTKPEHKQIEEEIELTPREIVNELDLHIIGQKNAKRAVAIALRNRTRRRKLDQSLRDEIYPKNIIMIGPTGVGKTEIARRLAKLCQAPFIKVEATKYTEVGYVGRDVESMVRDLLNVSISLVKQEFRIKVELEAEKKAEDVILEILIPEVSRPDTSSSFGFGASSDVPLSPEEEERKKSYETTKELMRKKLNSGKLDEKEIEIDQAQPQAGLPMMQVFGAGNLEDMDNQIQSMLGELTNKKPKKRKLPISEAREILKEQEVEKLLDQDKIHREAIRRAEEMGIIFIDEIDKVAGKDKGGGVDVSREGVQRDLLPIVEGATITTRYGSVKTDHMLFIAAGAFHISKPSDLIPELQGRFPIRVELEKLKLDDFVKILTATKSSLTKQYQALLAVDGVELNFLEDGITEIARIAFEVNEKNENIGARRLNTIVERVLEDISFDAPDLEPEQKKINVTSEFVQSKLKDIVEDRDLTRYIL